MRSLIVVMVLAAALALAPQSRAEEPHPIVEAVKAKLKDADKPFTMLVMVKVKPGMEEKFEAAFAEAIKGTRKEKGNLVYQLNQASEDGTLYAVYERWKNLDALRDHMKTPHIEALLKQLPDLLEGEPKVNVGIPKGE